MYKMFISFNNVLYDTDLSLLNNHDIDSIYKHVSETIKKSSEDFDIIYDDHVLNAEDSKLFNDFDILYVLNRPFKASLNRYNNIIDAIADKNHNKVEYLLNSKSLELESGTALDILHHAVETKSINMVDFVLMKMLKFLSIEHIQKELFNLYKFKIKK